MFHKIEDLIEHWKSHSGMTQRVLDAITDESMSQAVCEGHRTIGRIAWHVVTTIPEMMSHTGLPLDKMLNPEKPVPAKAMEIAGAYKGISAALITNIANEWNDESLFIEDELYGEKWQRRYTITALIQHEIHHRGQITVLMRQAGIKVPSLYGPAKEDWEQYGMPIPEV